MSKKYILGVATIGGLVFLTSLFPNWFGVCGLVNTSCVFLFDQIAENFLIFIPFIILSLITYKMRDETFRAWGTFAIVWVPLSMLMVLVAPEYGSAFLPIEKGTVAFFTSLLFVIISLIIIAWKYFATRSK